MEKILDAKRKTKIMAIILIIIAAVAILVGKIHSDNDNHYVLDVIKEKAMKKDENMQVTESIVKDQNAEYFDSKKLTYQLDIENQIAVLIDTSYSMGVNDTNSVVKNQAIDLSKGILSNVTNSKISKEVK